MKFAMATIFALALVMGVQCSWIPLAHHHLAEVAGHGLSYTAVSSPVHAHSWAHAHLPAAVTVHASPAWHHGSAVVVDHAHHGPALVVDAHHGHHGPALVVDAHHAHHAPIVHLAHHHEGEYIAKTRGAVHAAPLAGHVASVAAINVAPAPGTH